MDVINLGGQAPGNQTVWSNHPAHQLHQLGPHAASNTPQNVNIPDRFEQFVLGEGEKKVEEEADTRTASTAIFTFNKEDHTLGNLLRDRLLQNSHVTFSGYKVPHPLFAKFELRIQTDGQITPKEALTAACQELIRELNKLKTNFQDAYNLTKMVQGGPNGA